MMCIKSINTLNDQQVEEQATVEEASQTLKRGDKAKLTANEDVKYHNDLPKVTVQNRTPQGDNRESIPTCLEQLNGMTYIEDMIPQETPI